MTLYELITQYINVFSITITVFNIHMRWALKDTRVYLLDILKTSLAPLRELGQEKLPPYYSPKIIKPKKSPAKRSKK